MLTGSLQTCDRGPNSFLDIFIVDKNLVNIYDPNNYNQLIVVPYPSDHSAVIFNCILSSNVTSNEILYRYVYKNADWIGMNKKIELNLGSVIIPTNRNLNVSEIDMYAEKLQKVVVSAIEEKIKKIPINDRIYIDESSQTKALIHNMCTLRRRKKRARNTEATNNINNSIKLLKNMINNSIAHDYRQFWHSTLRGIAVNNDVFKIFAIQIMEKTKQRSM